MEFCLHVEWKRRKKLVCLSFSCATAVAVGKVYCFSLDSFFFSTFVKSVLSKCETRNHSEIAKGFPSWLSIEIFILSIFIFSKKDRKMLLPCVHEKKNNFLLNLNAFLSGAIGLHHWIFSLEISNAKKLSLFFKKNHQK